MCTYYINNDDLIKFEFNDINFVRPDQIKALADHITDGVEFNIEFCSALADQVNTSYKNIYGNLRIKSIHSLLGIEQIYQ